MKLRHCRQGRGIRFLYKCYFGGLVDENTFSPYILANAISGMIFQQLVGVLRLGACALSHNEMNGS